MYFCVIEMDIFSKNAMNFIQFRWYQLTLWLMDYDMLVIISKFSSNGEAIIVQLL